MIKKFMFGTVGTTICCLLASPLLAADPTPKADSEQPAGVQPAEPCLTHLREFSVVMEQDGYWMTDSGYSNGYPMSGYGTYARGPDANIGVPIGYQSARPGYEIRTLLSGATILARHGKQQPCEDVLATTKEIYSGYISDMRTGKLAVSVGANWRQMQIAAAVSVVGDQTVFRSDQLVGSSVRNLKDEALGTVEDIVMAPGSAKIVYLVIGRGGIFGIDEKYVPVPWSDFKITPIGHTLVLNSSKTVIAAAPLVSKNEHLTDAHFIDEAKLVDAYWMANDPAKAAN